jgi:hypothetical protein
MNQVLRFFPLFALFQLLLIQNGNAQSTDASVTGKITNTQSKPLPGATVTIRNNSTGFSSTAQTNSEGTYVFRQLPWALPIRCRPALLVTADK